MFKGRKITTPPECLQTKKGRQYNIFAFLTRGWLTFHPQARTCFFKVRQTKETQIQSWTSSGLQYPSRLGVTSLSIPVSMAYTTTWNNQCGSRLTALHSRCTEEQKPPNPPNASRDQVQTEVCQGHPFLEISFEMLCWVFIEDL